MTSMLPDSEALLKLLGSSGGIMICVLTMITTFVFFPPKNEEEPDPTLENTYLQYKAYKPKATWSSDFKVLKAMWFSKITGKDLQERLNCFYKDQADLYDSYRIRMLHGRPKMLKAVARHTKKPQTKNGQLVWVDLAAGTGYNMESFVEKSLDKFRAIYLLDLCEPLCQVARRERAEKYDSKKIRVIHGDATDFECEGLPSAGTVDLVTISYSLVMIPDWRKAIANAKRLLKPGGMIAVSDFTLDPNQTGVMKAFWKKVFAQDHVYLNEQHLQTLYKEFTVIEAEGAYGTLPYTPFFLQPAYYHFCGLKSKAKN